MEGIYEELKCYSYNFVINVIKPNFTWRMNPVLIFIFR
jgi:hypothetical protein